MPSQGDENESENKAKKCPNCGLDHPLQPRKKCSTYGSVYLICQKENLWARVTAPETKVEHEDGKGKEKTLGRVITTGVQVDATDKIRKRKT